MLFPDSRQGGRSGPSRRAPDTCWSMQGVSTTQSLGVLSESDLELLRRLPGLALWSKTCGTLETFRRPALFARV